jgi:hypothetical protein
MWRCEPGIRGSIKREQCKVKWHIVDQGSTVVLLVSTAFPPLGTQVKTEESGRLEGTISAVWRVTFAVEAKLDDPTTTSSMRRCPSQTREEQDSLTAARILLNSSWEHGTGAGGSQISPTILPVSPKKQSMASMRSST